MGKRKVSILEQAATSVAEIGFFIESKGLPATAKKFVEEVFEFFEKLSDDIMEHRPCKYERWKNLGYRCANYKKKYIVAYLSLSNEIIICDFVSSKLLTE
jgi:hypothetical protein